MKWLTGIIFLALIAAAAFFAGGYYGLAPSTQVSRSIEIERPASIVFPLIANLRTFNEVSPWYDRDPKADYTYSGPREGKDQAATWVSSVQSVGSGDQKITEVKENEQVDMALNLNGKRQTAVWAFAPGRVENGSKVTWTATLNCGPSLLAVPCRYLNLVDQIGVQQDIETGLARLKKAAEALPALEIASLKPEFVTVQELDFAYLEPDTTRDEAAIDQALKDSFAMVSGFIRSNNLAAAGPPMAVLMKQETDKMSYRAGIPYAGATPATQIAVKTSKTPSGLALKVITSGSRENLKPIYARIEAYMQAHRLRASGPSWEVYLDDLATADPATRRTAIYYPLEEASYSPTAANADEEEGEAAPVSAAP